MLRVMLRYKSRKSLILKQCYMLRFFENECGSQIGRTMQKVQNAPRQLSRLAIYIIFKKT